MSDDQPINQHPVARSGGLVVALGASEVVLAAVGGIGLARIFLLAIATLAFVVAYVVMPSPGKAQYDAAAVRPVHVMRAGSLLARRRHRWLRESSPAGVRRSRSRSRGRWPAPVARPRPRGPRDRRALRAPPTSFAARDLALVGGWSTILATWAVSRRIVQMLDVQRSQAQCLSRLREGALLDAEGRRRGWS